jgi:8-oxo-dGTP diphosphatase
MTTPNPAIGSHLPEMANVIQHPAVAVDVVILTIINGELRVLLTKRNTWPFIGLWSIPGTFVGIDEGLETAARRELEEGIHVDGIYLEQLYTFGDPKRDPRYRVITVVYYALVNANRLRHVLRQNADSDHQWLSMYNLPSLAFDHREILSYTLQRLRGKLEYTTIGFQLLAPEFTLTELQEVYEVILGRQLDKRNFRKKILSTEILEDTKSTKMEGPHRPARLYRFRPNISGE